MKVFKGKRLLREEDFLEEIFIINSGKLNLFIEYKDGNIKIINLLKNEYFGDFMITNERSHFSIKVKTWFCELLILRKIHIMRYINEFEDIFKRIIEDSYYNTTQFKKIIKNRKAIHERK